LAKPFTEEELLKEAKKISGEELEQWHLKKLY
jgi:hypothetical protein